MKFPEPIPISEIANMIGAKLYGDKTMVATGINEIHKVEKGDITFSDLEKYFNKALTSEASFVILNEAVEVPEGKAILVCDEPFKAYDSIVKRFRPYRSMMQSIDPTAKIHPSAVIEHNVSIGAHSVIGKDTVVETGVVIRDHCYIGERCIIQSGAMIGTDAFYFKRHDRMFTKWTTGGRVVIGDDVYIGANCTVNKGVSGDTVIGDGTKLDCLIHVGHGAVIGRHCLLAAQVGVAGKTIIGDHCVIYGQVGIAQNLVIGEGVTILAKAGVAKSLEPNKIYFGIPAAEAKEKYKELASLRVLPQVLKDLRKGEKSTADSDTDL